MLGFEEQPCIWSLKTLLFFLWQKTKLTFPLSSLWYMAVWRMSILTYLLDLMLSSASGTRRWYDSPIPFWGLYWKYSCLWSKISLQSCSPPARFRTEGACQWWRRNPVWEKELFYPLVTNSLLEKIAYRTRVLPFFYHWTFPSLGGYIKDGWN